MGRRLASGGAERVGQTSGSCVAREASARAQSSRGQCPGRMQDRQTAAAMNRQKSEREPFHKSAERLRSAQLLSKPRRKGAACDALLQLFIFRIQPNLALHWQQLAFPMLG